MEFNFWRIINRIFSKFKEHSRFIVFLVAIIIFCCSCSFQCVYTVFTSINNNQEISSESSLKFNTMWTLRADRKCINKSHKVNKKLDMAKEMNMNGARRVLSARITLGSSPPRCTSKCGRCTPCRPVHVPVPPGVPVTTEYYPEAWRCKCGNKLYIP